MLICGRRAEALAEAKEKIPSLQTFQCDVSREEERTALAIKVMEEAPALNVIVNNAGVQQRPPRLIEAQEWRQHAHEIATNLEAPLHFAMLFLPHLLTKQNAAIINITSGLAFSPIAFMPTYCATKAALHSWTLSLRYQLKNTPVEVIEVAPPAVNTDLGGKGLHDFGVPLDEFGDYVFQKLEEGSTEFGYGSAEMARIASPERLNEMFEKVNGMMAAAQRPS